MLRSLAVGAALLGFAAGQAQAQYYPPDGYEQRGYEPRGYEQRGYEPRGYGPPPGYGPPGSRCNAYLDTPYGPRERVCPMGIAKPVGAPCTCPSRRPYGPPAEGRVIP